ncbi:pyridoxal phosphate-dependent decarboxylase family protein [Roseisolibacter agri]|uniref:Aspartate aminotransferase family protein n=1 Tax=Roseisolibacter agri TaxID=2014610 RepID=A0AA37V8U1_9BACT|nr:aspartate aminotransferase family protein [Roseisolibacter agri]GLC23773.1 aspartate aminotransferase family protein [Roseisolibacter agri]
MTAPQRDSNTRAAEDVLAALEQDAAPEAGQAFVTLAAEYLAAAHTGDGPVSSSVDPGTMAARFREPVPRGGQPLAAIVERLRRDVVADANRLAHPMAMGHQVSPPLPAGIWTDVLVSALNQSVAVSEMSPTGTAVEAAVIRWMAELAGFGPRAGGTLTSGGTEATFAALLAARSRALPEVWTRGVGAQPPAIVCGEHAHYAVSRAAGELGIGLRNVVTVPSRDLRMDPEALERTLQELDDAGRKIMAVVATAGSTATGSFDDLEAIADACEKRDAWLHVDGAHGASALLSATHRERVRGLARAHSVTWDPHKMLLLPLAAGVVLVRDERWLEAAFAQKAPYLFHAPQQQGAEEFDAAPRVWDQGIRSFQCSRRLDALKVWVAFQRHGADGLGALYDHLCATAVRLHAKLAAHPAFEPLHAPESNILCFRWTGAGDMDDATLDALQHRVRARFNRSGDGWITATVLDGRRVLRVTLMNPRTGDAHLDALLAGLAAAGEAERSGAASATSGRARPAVAPSMP